MRLVSRPQPKWLAPRGYFARARKTLYLLPSNGAAASGREKVQRHGHRLRRRPAARIRAARPGRRRLRHPCRRQLQTDRAKQASGAHERRRLAQVARSLQQFTAGRLVAPRLPTVDTAVPGGTTPPNWKAPVLRTQLPIRTDTAGGSADGGVRRLAPETVFEGPPVVGAPSGLPWNGTSRARRSGPAQPLESQDGLDFGLARMRPAT